MGGDRDFDTEVLHFLDQQLGFWQSRSNLQSACLEADLQDADEFFLGDMVATGWPRGDLMASGDGDGAIPTSDFVLTGCPERCLDINY